MSIEKKSWRFALVVAGALALGACGSSDDEAGDEGASGYTYEPAPQTSTQDQGDVSSQNLGYDNQQQSAPTQAGLQAEAGDRIFFGFDGHALDARAQDVLRKQAIWMTRFPSITVTIEGHCDERGTREYNIALGDRRANAAKSYLTSLGIAPGRISTVSYGKERPQAACSSEQCWAQNRRSVTVVNGY